MELLSFWVTRATASEFGTLDLTVGICGSVACAMLANEIAMSAIAPATHPEKE
jgi:hypothetical protein